MRTILTVALIVAGIAQTGVVRAAHAQHASSGAKPIPVIGDAQRGEALVTRWCTSCHRLSDDGSATDQAPTIRWIAGQVKQQPNYIRTFLNHPHAPMPPLDLDRGEIEDVIVYFKGLAAR
jgi:mono/diheme cytochrome c family protein